VQEPVGSVHEAKLIDGDCASDEGPFVELQATPIAFVTDTIFALESIRLLSSEHDIPLARHIAEQLLSTEFVRYQPEGMVGGLGGGVGTTGMQ
jgi:hypothetical protein